MRLALALVSTLLIAGAASAQFTVDMSFDPDVAASGDAVTFAVSIVNTDPDPVDLDIALTASYGDFVIGPLPLTIPLPPFGDLSTSFSFIVPQLPYDGTLSLTLDATDGSYSTSATASLTIVTDGSGDGSLLALGDVTGQMMQSLSAPVGNEDATMSQVKTLYR